MKVKFLENETNYTLSSQVSEFFKTRDEKWISFFENKLPYFWKHNAYTRLRGRKRGVVKTKLKYFMQYLMCSICRANLRNCFVFIVLKKVR